MFFSNIPILQDKVSVYGMGKLFLVTEVDTVRSIDTDRSSRRDLSGCEAADSVEKIQKKRAVLTNGSFKLLTFTTTNL